MVHATEALVAGGALAAVLGLGASAAGAAGTPGPSGTSVREPAAGRRAGRLPGGATPPAVGGRITALSGDDITVQTRTTRRPSSSLPPARPSRRLSGPNGASTTSSDSALKVGDFIGVQGTKNSDGTVTASTVMIGGPQPGGKSGPAGPPGAAGKGGRLPAGA